MPHTAVAHPSEWSHLHATGSSGSQPRRVPWCAPDATLGGGDIDDLDRRQAPASSGVPLPTHHEKVHKQGTIARLLPGVAPRRTSSGAGARLTMPLVDCTSRIRDVRAVRAAAFLAFVTGLTLLIVAVSEPTRL